MAFQILDQLPIPGAFTFHAFDSLDERGRFTKLFSPHALPVAFGPVEIFLNRSSRGVVRGMHLQTGPATSDKIVLCISGAVHDVLIDVRHGRFDRTPVVNRLSSEEANALFIPAGVAHGFQALHDDTAVLYLTGAAHAAEHEAVLNPLTCGVCWPIAEPILSARDRAAPSLAAYLRKVGA